MDDDLGGYNLTSNTGKNDSGSAWGAGFLSFATGLTNTVASVTNAFKGSPKPQATPGTTPGTPVATKTDSGKLWLIGGAVAAGLLVLVLLLRR